VINYQLMVYVVGGYSCVVADPMMDAYGRPRNNSEPTA